MNRSHYRLLALVLSLLIFGCTPAAAPTGAPPSPPKAATTPAATAAQKAPAAPSKAPVSFKGKAITLLVPYSAGGVADIRARLLVPFMQKYFPGNPTVIVQNMPGGGGMVGDNWVYNVAPKDGTVIGQPSTHFVNALLTPDQAKYDFARCQWLGAVTSASPTFADVKLGIKSAEELPRVAQTIFLGDQTTTSSRTMPTRLLLKLLGLDFKFVTGYGSSGDMRAAIQRGELNFTADGLEGYLEAVGPMVRAGSIVPMAQDGIVVDGKVVRDPRVPDIPTYHELLVRLKGESIKQSAEYRAIDMEVRLGALKSIWFYPPGVPQETVAAMAEAFDKTFADPEMIREWEKATGARPISLNGAQVRQEAEAAVELLKKDPEAGEVLLALAREAT